MSVTKINRCVAVLFIVCVGGWSQVGGEQNNQNQAVPKAEDKKNSQKPGENKSQQSNQPPDQKQEQKPGGGANNGSEQNKDKDKVGQNSPNSSRMQVLYPPSDIVVDDSNCASRITALSVRSTAKDVKLQGPVIVGGSLADKDSSTQMPPQMFQLLEKKGNEFCGNYTELKPDSAHEISDDLTESPLYIGLREEWGKAGVYTGNLWIAAKGDSAGQAVAVKVVFRPWTAWLWGTLAILVGALISWFAVVYVVRQRQMATNRILIVRLRNLLDELTSVLNTVAAARAPKPTKTLQHIQEIRDKGLRELLDDKELSVLAGITVPPTGTVTVIDDINGVSAIVQNGFSKLLDLWKQQSPNQPPELGAAFAAMDNLGAVAQPLAGLDLKIQTILNTAPVPKDMAQPSTSELPSEEAIVHQIKTTSLMLEVISLTTVVVLGVYVLIWKNPGFGSPGNYIEALLWGLGLKLGGDVTKLGPSDVRTAFGIKVPAAAP
jgi:hypothetical protein